MLKKTVTIILFILIFGVHLFAKQITIVTPKDATITEKFAAEELQSYLGKITGENFEIKNSKGGTKFGITVANQKIQDLNLTREEYVIKSVKDGLILSGGGNRGTLYAVYDFLEKLGCRWYYPYEIDEIVPKLTVEEVLKACSNLDFVEKPDFAIRIKRLESYDITGPGTALGDNIMAQMPRFIDWACKNRFNSYEYGLDHSDTCFKHWPSYQKVFNDLEKRDMVIGAGGHAYFLFLPDSEFSKHEDWWPERDGKRTKAGQFCTNNKEAVDYYTGNIIKFLKDNPQVKFFTAWPADTGGWCQCKLCGDDTTIAERYMKLGNETIKRVQKELPDVTFTHFAYGSHLEPPKVEKPLPGTMISICTWGRNFSQTFPEMISVDNYENNLFKNAFGTWRKICDENKCSMILHEKYLRHLGLGFHPLPLNMLKGDIEYFKEQRLDGFELPMGWMGKRTKALNYYTAAKLMWDTDTDVNSLVNDYFDKFYGVVASIMHEAYKNVELAQPDLQYFKEINKLHQDYVTLEQRYSQDRLDYALNALKYFGLADGCIEQAIAGANDEQIVSRIKRFAKSLYYVELEYKGLSEITMVMGHLGKADIAVNETDYKTELMLAQSKLDKVKAISQERNSLWQENPGDGFYWDITWEGPYCVFVDADIEKIQKRIDDGSKADFNSLVRTIWQIGIFDGSYSELGKYGSDFAKSMNELPRCIEYTVSADNPDKWPEFMPHHWPAYLKHGASANINFKINQGGKYILTVGQLSTGEAETIDVLLDGQKVGSYTTVSKEKYEHNIEFEIAAEGKHTISLSEYQTGGGYALDAIKLVKAGK